ncbi:hypothetical protein HJC23_008392, partial [Cyclotella cryptica]
GTTTTGNDRTNNSSNYSPNTDSAQEGCVSAENNYHNNNNTLRILITMSIGSTDDVGTMVVPTCQSKRVETKERRLMFRGFASLVVIQLSESYQYKATTEEVGSGSEYCLVEGSSHRLAER